MINGRKSYQYKSYTSGWNSAVKIDDIAKVARYIRKYITKDMPMLFGQNRYWRSNDLKKPVTIDNPNLELDHLEPFWSHEGEYGISLHYNNDKALGGWPASLLAKQDEANDE